MKSTTKIVLGILIVVFSLSIIFIAYVASRYDSNYPDHGKVVNHQIPQGNMEAPDLPPFKVACLTVDPDASVQKWNWVGGTIFLKPSGTGDKGNKLSFSENISSFVSYNVEGDTLIIKLKHGDIYNAYRGSEGSGYIFVHGVDINLAIDSDIEVISNIPQFGVTAEDIAVNEATISANNAEIKVLSSKIGVLNIVNPQNGSKQHALIERSEIGTYNLDLDNLYGWRVSESKIGVENLTGGGQHDIQQSKQESTVVNWIPKSKDASLKVQLFGDTVSIKFQ